MIRKLVALAAATLILAGCGAERGAPPADYVRVGTDLFVIEVEVQGVTVPCVIHAGSGVDCRW